MNRRLAAFLRSAMKSEPCRNIPIALIDPTALALSCSRGSPTFVGPSPVNQALTAMRVQPSGVSGNGTQDIGLYCLTPARCRRYSSLNLCSPCPAWGVKKRRNEGVCIVMARAGIRLVNTRFDRDRGSHFSQNRREVRHPRPVDCRKPATDHRPLATGVTRCSN